MSVCRGSAEEEEAAYLRAHARALGALRRRLAPLREQYRAEVARLSAVRASRRRQLRRARTLRRARAGAQAAVRGALLRLQLRRGAEGGWGSNPRGPAERAGLRWC